MTKQSGMLLTIEGGEAVGKTSLIRELVVLLKPICLKIGRELVVTREPGGTPTADLMRDIFVKAGVIDPLDATSELLLVSAARAQHVSRLLAPKIQDGAIVVCDRYIDSSYVYQGVLGGVSTKVIDEITNIAISGLLPDITFLLDVDVKTVTARIHERHYEKKIEASRYDEKPPEFHQKVMLAFRERANQERERFVVLDGKRTPFHNAEIAVKELSKRFSRIFGS